MLIRIYKIVNDINDEIYVGSTVQKLNRRLNDHKYDSKKFIKRNGLYVMVNEVGWEHFKIVLIEEFEVDNKNQKLRKEQEYMDSLKPSLNDYNAVLTLCPHNKKRTYCVECKGTSICIHNKYKPHCKDCNGSQFCNHKKLKYKCKECNDFYCEFCDKEYAGKYVLYKHIIQFHFRYMVGLFE